MLTIPINRPNYLQDIFPTSGSAVTVVVRGSGFRPGLASCRIASATPGSAFTHAGYAGKTDIRFPASVINESTLTCAPPGVLAPGPGLLSVAVGCTTVPCRLGNWGQHVPWNRTANGGVPWAAPAQIAYFTLIDVVIGQRPYIGQTDAELLIATHDKLRGAPIAVTAFLQHRTGPAFSTNWSWSWTVVPENGTNIVRFPLGGLPTALNTDLQITMIGAGVN
eukprot:SAG31_NODE_12200_length_959_cov_1.347674_1_plen_220_part_10